MAARCLAALAAALALGLPGLAGARRASELEGGDGSLGLFNEALGEAEAELANKPLPPHPLANLVFKTPGSGVKKSGDGCKLHWKYARALERECKQFWSKWQACSADVLEQVFQTDFGSKVPKVAEVKAACSKVEKDFDALVVAVQEDNLPGPKKDLECYPTELAFKTPAELDPNEVPPEHAFSGSTFSNWYGDKYTPLNVETSPVTRGDKGRHLQWLYNSMLVVSNNDYKGQLKNLMAGLLQPVPKLVGSRAEELLAEVRQLKSGLGHEELQVARMGPSNSLQRNVDGARDAWERADAFLRAQAEAKAPLKDKELLKLMLTAHKMMYTGLEVERAGVLRGPMDPAPFAGPFNTDDVSFYCASRIPGAKQRLVDTRPDGAAVQYLDSLSVEDAVLQVFNYTALALNDQTESVVVVGARVMMGLASIHPFPDGNGRIARLVLDFLFYRAGLLPPTGYNAMLAIFPRNELCWQPSPVAGANELMRGLRSSYRLPQVELPAAKDKASYCPAGKKERVVLRTA